MAAHEADYVDPTAELGKEWLDIEARRNCRWEHSFECACVCRCVGACACVRACVLGCVCVGAWSACVRAWVRVRGGVERVRAGAFVRGCV